MEYIQKVEIDCNDIKKVKNEFNNLMFLKHLTKPLPLKIIEWDGTDDGAKAHLAFWFFGWKDFKVKHQDYKKRSSFLSFIDKGFVLPFGLTFWEHKHTVEKVDSKILVKDLLEFSHGSKVLEYLLFPILVSPIFIRKILYHLYFNKIK